MQNDRRYYQLNGSSTAVLTLTAKVNHPELYDETTILPSTKTSQFMGLYHEHLSDIELSDDGPTISLPAPFLSNSVDANVVATSAKPWKAAPQDKQQPIARITHFHVSAPYRNMLNNAAKQLNDYYASRLIGFFPKGKKNDVISSVLNYVQYLLIHDLQAFTGHTSEIMILNNLISFLTESLPLIEQENEKIFLSIQDLREARDRLVQMNNTIYAQELIKQMQSDSYQLSCDALRLAAALMMGKEKHQAIRFSIPENLKRGIISDTPGFCNNTSRATDNPYISRLIEVASAITSHNTQELFRLADSHSSQRRAQVFLRTRYAKPYQNSTLSVRGHIEKNQEQEYIMQYIQSIDYILDVSMILHQYEKLLEIMQSYTIIGANLYEWDNSHNNYLLLSFSALQSRIQCYLEDISYQIQNIKLYYANSDTTGFPDILHLIDQFEGLTRIVLKHIESVMKLLTSNNHIPHKENETSTGFLVHITTHILRTLDIHIEPSESSQMSEEALTCENNRLKNYKLHSELEYKKMNYIIHLLNAYQNAAIESFFNHNQASKEVTIAAYVTITFSGLPTGLASIMNKDENKNMITDPEVSLENFQSKIRNELTLYGTRNPTSLTRRRKTKELYDLGTVPASTFHGG